MSASSRLIDGFGRSGRRPLRILGASGQLGYGIPKASFEAGVARAPDMIGCDMGSIDIGPAYLGSGAMATSRTGAKRDLQRVLRAARSLDIPLLIGSAGSAGAKPHLEETLAILREIAREDGLHFTLASLAADIDPDALARALSQGRVAPLDGMPALTEAEIRAATHIVGQMGMEAFERALAADVDVVVAGRACDTGIFAALPKMLGFPTGLCIHLAKIVECASLCCAPGGRDPILATLDDDGFELESMAAARAATPASVAAHSLYEQANPFEIREPAGKVDLTDARFDALDPRRTRVSGAPLEPALQPTIKLEGARLVGQRVVLLSATADPRFIAQHRELLERIKTVVQDLVCGDEPRDYELSFRVYGVDGVSRANAALLQAPPTEAFILGQCLAQTETRAQEVMRTTKQYLLHLGFEGRLSTAGNLAFPFTPPELTVGPAYRFNIYHLMHVDDLASHFPLRLERL